MFSHLSGSVSFFANRTTSSPFFGGGSPKKQRTQMDETACPAGLCLRIDLRRVPKRTADSAGAGTLRGADIVAGHVAGAAGAHASGGGRKCQPRFQHVGGVIFWGPGEMAGF